MSIRLSTHAGTRLTPLLLVAAMFLATMSASTVYAHTGASDGHSANARRAYTGAGREQVLGNTIQRDVLPADPRNDLRVNPDNTPRYIAVIRNQGSTDAYMGNNAASATTTVDPPLADLEVTKSATPNPVTQGSPLTYTVTLVNHGPDVAQTVWLTDTMPSGVSFNFATITQGYCAIGFPLLICQFGAMDPGEAIVLTIRVTPNAPGAITNHVIATTATSDPDTSNNAASATTTVLGIVLSPTSLPGGTVGAPYSQTISASNGTTPYSFAVSSGALPPGLTLSAAGSLSGTPTTIGSFSFGVTATDANGRTGSQSYTIAITFNFAGFFAPVDNLPAVNVVQAGGAVPVKFRLGGNHGLGILATSYPVSRPIVCDASAPLDPIEETVTKGKSGLSYDPATDTYTYVWKTIKSWSGSCRQLIVRLSDGADHVANFRFN